MLAHIIFDIRPLFSRQITNFFFAVSYLKKLMANIIGDFSYQHCILSHHLFTHLFLYLYIEMEERH